MNKLKNQLIGLVVLSLSSVIPAFAEEKEPLLVIYPDFPPYIYKGADKKPAGILSQAITNVVESINLPVKQKVIPMKRVFVMMNSGQADFTTMLLNQPQIKDKVVFSKATLFPIALSFYHLPDLSPVPKSFDELKGRSVIRFRGYSYGGKVTFLEDKANNIRNMISNTHDGAINLLLAKRAEILLQYDVPYEGSYKRVKNADKSKIQKHTLYSLPVHLAWNPGNDKADWEQLSVLIQQEIAKLKEAGYGGDEEQ